MTADPVEEVEEAPVGAQRGLNPRSCAASSMTDLCPLGGQGNLGSLNPRSCAASSMTSRRRLSVGGLRVSQSAFVRGFIDDVCHED